MKSTLQKFFKSKKNKIIASSLLAFTILAGAGFYLNSQAQEQKKQEQARIEKIKAEEQAKKQQEEKEKNELAKAEEERKKAEELEKEQQKQAEEEKKKAEVDKREKDNFVENKQKNEKKETQKNSNSTSKKTENSKKNKKKDNNDNNDSNKENTFEVEGDGYPTVLGNSGRFFSSKSEADNWAFAQLENDDSNWTKSGYRRFSTSQCKRNGQIGWTVNFRK